SRNPPYNLSQGKRGASHGQVWLALKTRNLRFEMFIVHRNFFIVLLSVIFRRTDSGTYTAVTRSEFTSVLWLDGEAVDSYRSDGAVIMPMRNWMREGGGHDLWNTVRRLNMQQWDRGRTAILNDKGIQMAGAAVLQGRFGCEIELNPYLRIRRTFAQFGWNGRLPVFQLFQAKVGGFTGICCPH
ncbi:hypothetical protein COCON_G00055000, partial [Conger conger]